MVTDIKTYCLCISWTALLGYSAIHTKLCGPHPKFTVIPQHCLALKHTWSICTSHTLLQQKSGVYSDAYKPIKVTDSLWSSLVCSHERQRYIICIPLCTEKPIQLSPLETTLLPALNSIHFSSIWRNSKEMGPSADKSKKDSEYRRILTYK